jgi:uncharacterized membrane protein YeaQ/YmgE (transglycosylase-associated protein family)
MDVLAWIVIGLIAGWLAHALLGGRGGFFGNIAVGLIGGVLGGVIFEAIGFTPQQSFAGSLVSATIGAIVFLLIWRAIRGR